MRPSAGNGSLETKREDRAEKYISKINAVSGAGGDSTTFHVASVLVNGFDLPREVAIPIIKRWNETNAINEKWTQRLLIRKIDEAIKKGPGSKPRGWLIDSDDRWEPTPGQRYGKREFGSLVVIRAKVETKPEPATLETIDIPKSDDSNIIDHAIRIFRAKVEDRTNIRGPHRKG